MTDANREEIRGITYSMMKTFVVCTISIIGAIIGGCVYIRVSISTLDFRTATIEDRNKTDYTPLIARVDKLEAWKIQVEAFYMPPKKQSSISSDD